jgi:uncharacterized membrane protein (DUF485 family)
LGDARGDQPVIDWTRVEASPEFRELADGRRRFSAVAGAVGIGAGLLYILLWGIGRGFMGESIVGAFSVGFLGGIALIVVTWVITALYMRRSARVWAPLEERVRERALAPPARDAGRTAPVAPGTEEPSR